MSDNKKTHPRISWTFDEYTNSEIRRAAATGIYDIRGGGSKRKLPHFDDLLFLGASMSRYPLEGYRETCNTKVTLGTRYAKKPLELDIPITIAGMSFGALSGSAKEALGDSLYETDIFVKGSVKSLGADCIEKKMEKKHLNKISALLKKSEIKNIKPDSFKRYGSARKLYNFNIDNVSSY